MKIWGQAKITLGGGGEFSLRTTAAKSIFADKPDGWRLRTSYGFVYLTCHDPMKFSGITPEMIEMWHCKVLLLTKQR